MRTFAFALTVSLLLLLTGCGYRLGQRHFAGPILPVPESEQRPSFVVGDDRSITFVRDRLEVSLQPVTADMLNRQLGSFSTYPPGFFRPNPYVGPINPYTYGDWRPSGEDRAPERFSVFQLKIKNYAYPKVRVDPGAIEIVTDNGRRYQALSLSALTEYYWPYAIAYAGNTYAPFKERQSILRRTLFNDDMIFSAQEKEGYVIFPALDHDVEGFEVRIESMALRYDFRNEPIESVDIPYRFSREVYLARKPRDQK